VDAATVEEINRPGGHNLLHRWAEEGNGHRLAEVVTDERINPQWRRFAMHHFWWMHRRGFHDDQVLIAALVVALSDPNPWVRRVAARQLYGPDWDIREAVPALRRLLADKDDQVRLAAAITPSDVGDQTA